MINKKLPVLNDKDSEKMLDRLKELSQSYIPGWKFSHENPDPSSVVALLFANMIAQTDKAYKNVVNKHKIQYLNLFDGIKSEPLQSAKSYVVFETSSGISSPVYIPKNTGLTAGEDKYGQSIIFETTSDFTAVDSTVDSIFVTQKKSDKITKLYDKTDGDLKECNVTAFDLSLDNISKHVFSASYKNLFEDIDNIKLVANIKANTEKKLSNITDKFVSSKIKWALYENGEYIYFDKVEKLKDGKILLEMENHVPVKNEENDEYSVVMMTNAGLTSVEMSSFSLEFSEKELIADDVFCSNLSQNVNHFKPFGSPLEIYSECMIENKKAFSRRGAKITLDFDIDINVLHQDLEMPEEDVDYKVIMKKPPKEMKQRPFDVKADYVIWEYLTPFGWKRLLSDDEGGSFFNGEKTGKQSVSFICPDDMISFEEKSEAGRIRIRLLRAENLYRMPATQYVPVINNLVISYSYDEKPQLPQKAQIINNFEIIDITDDLSATRPTSLFYNKEHDKTAMYMGFENSPSGTPISMYFNIDNPCDVPVDFSVECLVASEFIPLKVIDNTNSMLNSGTIMMIIPPDIKPQNLFSKELYWIRFINGGKSEKPYNLPLIKGIYMNAVQVVNTDSHEDYFYVSDPDIPNEFKLSYVNLISAEVYINEVTDDTSEPNWVLWHRAQYAGETGRVYSIDYKDGTISFNAYAFSSFETDTSDETVKVLYKTYSGSEGNVDANAISSVNETIKYISNVYNPFEAYGGIDGYTEKTAAVATSALLRTRKRAVTEQDYFDVISQTCYGVKSIKCCEGIDLSGNKDENVMTIAVLMDEYNKGSHIFSSVKDEIRDRLLECSSIVPMGKELILSQPHFIKLNVRVWIDIEKMENSFDLQKNALNGINEFINPLTGGFDKKGWEIGVLPSKEQLIAYLKVSQKNINISKMVMTAEFKGKEYTIDNEVYSHINNPFAMAVNGEHTVYVSMK